MALLSGGARDSQLDEVGNDLPRELASQSGVHNSMRLIGEACDLSRGNKHELLRNGVL